MITSKSKEAARIGGDHNMAISDRESFDLLAIERIESNIHLDGLKDVEEVRVISHGVPLPVNTTHGDPKYAILAKNKY
jgi:hypothetical protein